MKNHGFYKEIKIIACSILLEYVNIMIEVLVFHWTRGWRLPQAGPTQIVYICGESNVEGFAHPIDWSHKQLFERSDHMGQGCISVAPLVRGIERRIK